MAEPRRQSNTPTPLLGHARDEIVAASACTIEATEKTLRAGFEERRLEWTYGPIEGRLPPGATDVASHLFSRRAEDEHLKYDFANSSITRSGPGYSYTVLNIRVERVALMTWCREANLLLPEILQATAPFDLGSPDFARPALTAHVPLQAENFSVGSPDFARPVLTVYEVPKPLTPEPVPEPAPVREHVKRRKWFAEFLTDAKKHELAQFATLAKATEHVDECMRTAQNVEPYKNVRSIEPWLDEVFPVKRSKQK